MTQQMPSWFAADQTFSDRDGWYIGSRTGFRVGPYPHREQAELCSRNIIARLQRCRTTGDRVRTVQAFVREQSQKEGQNPVGTASAPQIVGSLEAPPVRAGEQPKVWFRTNRVFAVDDVWFFATREEVDVGPYATREEAERDATRLAEILKESSSEAECKLAIMQFKSRPRLGSG